MPEDKHTEQKDQAEQQETPADQVEGRQEEEQDRQASGFLQRILAMPNDSIPKTVLMTVAVCLVCSVIVASAAISLKPLQEYNKLLDKQQNILKVAGLDDASKSVQESFEQIETRIVDLDTGEYAEDIEPDAYDARTAMRDPAMSEALSKDEDIAGLGRRAKYAKVYLVKDDQDQISKVVLPVSGYGLWSTLYGFISLEPDLKTVYRIIFYEHAETPGLGGEVDNPDWRGLWSGKELFDQDGGYQFNVIKGTVGPSTPDAEHKVDGLAGATLTSVGVDQLVRFWLTDQGFGPYLENLQAGQG